MAATHPTAPHPQLPAPGELLAPVCLQCGYSLDGLADTQPNCPECGTPVRRFPLTSTFTCEADPVPRPTPRLRTTMLSYSIGLVGAFIVTLWRELRGPHLRPWIPILGCGTLALLLGLPFLIVWRRARRRYPAKIVVDLKNRNLRFEHCTLNPNFGWPRSTGRGLDISFDDVVRVSSRLLDGLAQLDITTRLGRITLYDRLSNFYALAAVVEPLGRPPSRHAHWPIYAILAALVAALTAAAFLLASWLRGL